MDELHSMLRITDVLTCNLNWAAVEQDHRYKTSQHISKLTKKIWGCGVTLRVNVKLKLKLHLYILIEINI